VVQTLGLKLIAGRDLDLTTYTTDSSAMIINASMARLIGFKDPTKAIGQSLKDNGISWTVVGVMEDFILHSPFSTTKPLAIEGAHGWFNIIHVKYTAQRPINETLSAAERIFSKYNPTYPFNYKFVDEEYGKKFSDAKRIASISTFSAGLSIFISCLGLFGLVSFMAATRKKELAIRKVNGASVHQVVVLITKDFIKIIGLAFAIAAPITFYYLSKWLDSYSYKIDISWTVFAITALILLIITLITIGFQAIKAALANPIHSLKSE
jgi:ABC-type antimicrobial peptide transport system permease subunit